MFSRRARGVTIIELIIFMVIMGVAAAGIIGVINLSTRASADPLRRKQALMIAEALMEEVQLARFSFCMPNDPVAASAANQGQCNTPVQIGARAPGAARPYGNVAEYATVAGVAQSTFAVAGAGAGGADGDVNGIAFGAGNAALAGFRSTVELNYVAALGPAAAATAITSSAGALNALQITIVTTYGARSNDFVRLDAYRTRYAPTLLP